MKRCKKGDSSSIVLSDVEVCRLLHISRSQTILREWESKRLIEPLSLSKLKKSGGRRVFLITEVLRFLNREITKENKKITRNELLSGLLPCGKAGLFVFASQTTLRRWADEGLIKSVHLPGIRKDRRFPRKTLKKVKKANAVFLRQRI